MNLETDRISPEQRVAVSDPRFDLRMTGQFDDESALSTSWIWAAAILIAATFLVSGYMDEESRRVEGSTASRFADSYVSNTAMPMPLTSTSTFVATSQSMDERSAKGY